MAIANQEQFDAWNGDEGEQWTEHAARYDRAARHTWQRFLDAGVVHAGDVVLDIGCGTGQSTVDVAATADAVLGADLSAVMLEAARRRAADAGAANVEFVQADAQVHRFASAGFDVAMSRFGAMFFADAAAAFANIADAVRPGGRLALLAWQSLERNEWLQVVRTSLAAGRDLPTPPPDAPTPFSLAEPARVRSLLGAAGFADVELTAVDEPIELGRDADDAFEFISKTGVAVGLTESLEPAAREAALATLRAALEERSTPEGVLLGTSAWLITAGRT